MTPNVQISLFCDIAKAKQQHCWALVYKIRICGTSNTDSLHGDGGGIIIYLITYLVEQFDCTITFKMGGVQL